jgi:hypothetical protein
MPDFREQPGRLKEGVMRKLGMRAATVLAGVMAFGAQFAAAQVLPPRHTEGPPAISRSPSNAIDAWYCSYVWGLSYRCVELFAQDMFDGDTGRYVSSYVELRETVNDWVNADRENSFRTVSCNVPRSTLQMARLSGAIRPTALQTDSAECSGYGYRSVCTNFTDCSYDFHYVFTGTHTVEASLISPNTIDDGRTSTVRTDFTSGTKVRSVCDSIGAGTTQGGFTVDGVYWMLGVVGDPSAPEAKGEGYYYLSRCENKTTP